MQDRAAGHRIVPYGTIPEIANKVNQAVDKLLRLLGGAQHWGNCHPGANTAPAAQRGNCSIDGRGYVRQGGDGSSYSCGCHSRLAASKPTQAAQPAQSAQAQPQNRPRQWPLPRLRPRRLKRLWQLRWQRPPHPYKVFSGVHYHRH